MTALPVLRGTNRECGECIVCCVYPTVDDPSFSKPPMTHCENLSLPGPVEKDTVFYTGASCRNCKIHSSQPKVCREYLCSWRQGYGDEGDRPDKSLMLFDCSHGIVNAVEAKPLRDGQQNTPEGKELIERMSISMQRTVIVLSFYEREIERIEGRPVWRP